MRSNNEEELGKERLSAPLFAKTPYGHPAHRSSMSRLHQRIREVRGMNYGDYATTMREGLSKLTLADVNAAIRKHLTAKDLAVVMVVKDAESLKKSLVADEFSPIQYDAARPQELLDEDKVIGAKKLGIKADAVKITPVDDVFAK